MKTRILTFTLAAAALASCGKEDTVSTDGTRTPLRVTASVEGATRASDAQWNYGDEIGISGTSGNLGYTNVPYQCKDAAAGTFNPLGFVTLYFGAETGNFTAYYPYKEVTDGKIAADVKMQLAARTFDFLYAPQTQARKDAPDIHFVFSHRMSKVALHMLPGTGFRTVDMFTEAYRLELSPLHAAGTFDPATGATAVTGNPETLSFRHQESISGVSEWNGTYHNAYYPIILFPETVTGGVELKVVEVQSGTAYSATLTSGADGNLTLEPGKVYDFYVTVNKTGIVVSGATITDWTPGEVPNGGDVDATV